MESVGAEELAEADVFLVHRVRDFAEWALLGARSSARPPPDPRRVGLEGRFGSGRLCVQRVGAGADVRRRLEQSARAQLVLANDALESARLQVVRVGRLADADGRA